MTGSFQFGVLTTVALWLDDAPSTAPDCSMACPLQCRVRASAACNEKSMTCAVDPRLRSHALREIPRSIGALHPMFAALIRPAEDVERSICSSIRHQCAVGALDAECPSGRVTAPSATSFVRFDSHLTSPRATSPSRAFLGLVRSSSARCLPGATPYGEPAPAPCQDRAPWSCKRA